MSTPELTAIRAALVADGWASEEEAAAMPDEQVMELARTFNLEMQATADSVQQYRLSDLEIEVMHAQALFKFPGDEQPSERFSGVLLAAQQRRAWYKEAYKQGQKDAPTCLSVDGRTGSLPRETRTVGGQERPCFGDCGTCYFGQYESDRNGGKGKDCAESRLLIIKTDGRELPMILRAPPTSIRSVEGYLTNLVNQKLPMRMVRTRFSLTHEGAAANYCLLSLTLDGDKQSAKLPIADAQQMVAMTQAAPFLSISQMRALPEPDAQEDAGDMVQQPKTANGKASKPAAPPPPPKDPASGATEQQDNIPF